MILKKEAASVKEEIPLLFILLVKSRFSDDITSLPMSFDSWLGIPHPSDNDININSHSASYYRRILAKGPISDLGPTSSGHLGMSQSERKSAPVQYRAIDWGLEIVVQYSRGVAQLICFVWRCVNP
jgi:hypothetical protein